MCGSPVVANCRGKVGGPSGIVRPLSALSRDRAGMSSFQLVRVAMIVAALVLIAAAVTAL